MTGFAVQPSITGSGSLLRRVLLACIVLAVLLPTSRLWAASPNTSLQSTRDVLFLGDDTPRIIRFHLRFNEKSHVEAWKEYVKAVFERNDRNQDQILDLAEMRDFQGSVRNRPGNPLQSLLEAGRSRSSDRVLLKHTRTVRAVRISADGQSLFSASDDKTVKHWDLETGRLLTTYTGFDNGIRALAVSPDGTQLAVGGRDKIIRVWEVGKPEVFTDLEGHNDYVTSLVFLPDGRELASASFDGSVKLWDLSKSVATQTFQGADPLWTVDVTRDGKWIAAAGEGETIRIWNREQGDIYCEFQEPRVWTLAFSPDGQQLASSGPNKGIQFWDLADKKRLFVLDGHESAVREIAFSADGHSLVSGSWDKTARIWDLKTQKTTATIKGHRDYVQTVALTPDAGHIVTGSDDRSIRYWDAQTGEEKPFLRVGTLSLEQFQNFLIANEFAPFRVQESRSSATVTTSDGQNIEQSLITRLLVSRLDRDNDEKVSVDEIKNAAAALRPFDFNDDELISFDELNTLQEVRTDTTTDRVRQQNYADSAIELGGETTPRRIVYQVLYRYDRDRYEEGRPWDARNRLSKEEVKLSDEDFARIDLNSDRELDFQELETWLAAPQPDVELIVRLDTSAGNQPKIERMSDAGHDSTSIEFINNDGATMLRIGQLSIDLVVQNFQSTQLQTEQFLTQQFEQADINNNDYLEKEEAEGNVYFGNIYDDADRDRDEKLYPKELSLFVQERLLAGRSRVQLAVANQGFDLFNILDSDRNQRLGARELTSVASRMTILDQNDDQKLEISDIPHYFRFTFGPESIGLAVPVDNQPDNTGPQGMVTNSVAGPLWFQKMDRNGDQDLSQREFLGPLAIFEKIDTDGDGLISPAEALASEDQ